MKTENRVYFGRVLSPRWQNKMLFKNTEVPDVFLEIAQHTFDITMQVRKSSECWSKETDAQQL